MSTLHCAPSPSELEGFRRTQRLAYECAETISKDLKPGMTERHVAHLMKEWLLDHGVDEWFHQPFAWFGDRTAFRGLIGVKQLGGFNPAFYPGFRRLEENMPFILDCAPTYKGFTADIGYCGVLGENRMQERMMDDLLEYRQLIVDLVRDRCLLSEVSQAVDDLCSRHGYEPRHKAYPFSVLAHRVEKLPDDAKTRASVLNFGVRNVAQIVRHSVAGLRDGTSPLWSSDKRSEHPPTPGLWAVEPHIGIGAVGAKWEELLVITEDDAFWLDDDVPHVQRGIERGIWPLATNKTRKRAAA
ncbi:MAG: M24 family metallopeptidase [Alcanivoracaceae bacterium]|nr:M24 family metallopeptidase [Alcanivoracaceae bacterium]